MEDHEVPGPGLRARSSRNVPLAALPLLATGALWLVASDRFQYLEARSTDLVIPLVLAVLVSVFWVIRTSALSIRSADAVVHVLFIAGAVGFAAAAALSTLNALCDTRPARVFVTVVMHEDCYKSSCRSTIRGVPTLPTTAPTMTLQSFREERQPAPGDSVILRIKPGFFGRTWIARRDIRQTDPAQLACTRLQQAAVAGDTAALGSLLAGGLSVESDEPEIGCETPLMSAAGAGRSVALTYLLERGADPNHAGRNGETALMRAVSSGDKAAVETLLAHRADPMALAHSQRSAYGAMGLAVELGDTAMMRLIGTAIPHQATH